jgi:hypothetical protein
MSEADAFFRQEMLILAGALLFGGSALLAVLLFGRFR